MRGKGSVLSQESYAAQLGIGGVSVHCWGGGGIFQDQVTPDSVATVPYIEL